IVAEQEIVYSRGFGISALDSEYATVTPNTIFSIQDVTTNFTALSLVHLEENTSFKLDIPIVEYLPYFRTKIGAYDQITTRHILSHTAGFPENVELFCYWMKVSVALPKICRNTEVYLTVFRISRKLWRICRHEKI